MDSGSMRSAPVCLAVCEVGGAVVWYDVQVLVLIPTWILFNAKAGGAV